MLPDAIDDEPWLYDVVVSCACMQCMPPTEVARFWPAALRRIAKRVVAQELRGHGQYVDGHGWAHAYPEWVIHV